MSETGPSLFVPAPYGPADEESCPYPAMPSMQTFPAPSLYGLEPDHRTRQIVEQLRLGLASAETGRPPSPYSLLGETPDTRRLLGEILGHGEVLIRGERGDERLLVEESVFAGVWRERVFRGEDPVQDGIVVGPVPPSVVEWAEAPAGRRGFELPAEFPEDLMNAPSLLHEILAKARDHRPGRDDVLNLSLFPLSPADSNFLEGELGFGGLEILSRGYGECRVRLTAVPRVWCVRYFNAGNDPILTTLEITHLPAVALAATEDLEDSRRRLQEVLRVLG